MKHLLCALAVSLSATPAIASPGLIDGLLSDLLGVVDVRIQACPDIHIGINPSSSPVQQSDNPACPNYIASKAFITSGTESESSSRRTVRTTTTTTVYELATMLKGTPTTNSVAPVPSSSSPRPGIMPTRISSTPVYLDSATVSVTSPSSSSFVLPEPTPLVDQMSTRFTAVTRTLRPSIQNTRVMQVATISDNGYPEVVSINRAVGFYSY